MYSMRYSFIEDMVRQLQPESIIEIGLAEGVTARSMLQASPNAAYIGYDVFDTKDDQFHKDVSNGKPVISKADMQARLSGFGKSIKLIEGMTQDTLWNNPVAADFVFIDGDHRVEAIAGDYNAVKNSKVVVFDDYYINHPNIDISVFGCNEVVAGMDIIVSPKTIKLPSIRLAVYTEDKAAREIISSIMA